MEIDVMKIFADWGINSAMVIAVAFIIQQIKNAISEIRKKNKQYQIPNYIWIFVVLGSGIPMALIALGLQGKFFDFWKFLENIPVYAAGASFVYQFAKIKKKKDDDEC